MYYVYRIQSLSNKDKSHIGTTRSVKKRLALHNSGRVDKTAEYTPWRVSFYAAFTRKERAEAFKDFLNTKEGRRFAHEHLWSTRASSSHVADG